jgi:hypothetical protein
MLAASSRRVADQTAEHVNEQIRKHTEMNIAFYAQHPDQIGQRLHELDEEWDIERVLETGSSALSLLGLVAGITRNRFWLLLPLAVQGFFLQHALQGWCPPIEVFRRMGFRTEHEIDEERYALKLIRGDFQNLPDNGKIQRVVQAIRSH